MFKLGVVLSCLMLVACGGDGGSGVSGDKRLTELSTSEVGSFCEYLVSISRTVNCDGDNRTIGVESQAECIVDFQDSQAESPNCQVTVSQYESCTEDILDLSDSEFCAGTSFPASCAPLVSAECIGTE